MYKIESIFGITMYIWSKLWNAPILYGAIQTTGPHSDVSTSIALNWSRHLRCIRRSRNCATSSSRYTNLNLTIWYSNAFVIFARILLPSSRNVCSLHLDFMCVRLWLYHWNSKIIFQAASKKLIKCAYIRIPYEICYLLNHLYILSRKAHYFYISKITTMALKK